MAQLNITLDQDEILLLLGDSGGDLRAPLPGICGTTGVVTAAVPVVISITALLFLRT